MSSTRLVGCSPTEDQPVKDNTDLSSLEQVKVARASPSTREQPGKTIESDGH